MKFVVEFDITRGHENRILIGTGDAEFGIVSPSRQARTRLRKAYVAAGSMALENCTARARQSEATAASAHWIGAHPCYRFPMRRVRAMEKCVGKPNACTLPRTVGRKPRRAGLAGSFSFASPCAGFEPFVLVRPLKDVLVFTNR